MAVDLSGVLETAIVAGAVVKTVDITSKSIGMKTDEKKRKQIKKSRKSRDELIRRLNK